jgi:phosphoribosylanthranilate isomerase
LDSYSDRELGGSGETFDWALGKSFVQKADQKVIIAGGLNPENVKEAVEQTDPFGIDVSSGVEASPGMKDVMKLKRFIEGARSV